MRNFNSLCSALVAILSSWTLHVSWLICLTVGNFCLKKSSIFQWEICILNLEFLPLRAIIFLFQIFSDGCRHGCCCWQQWFWLKFMLSDWKTYCWELLVNVLLQSLIFRVKLLLSKGTSHWRGGCCILFWNLVLCFSPCCQRYFFQACHDVPNSWCDCFMAVTKRSQAGWLGEWGSGSWLDISFILEAGNFSMLMVVKYCTSNASSPSGCPHFPCSKAPQPEGTCSWQALGSAALPEAGSVCSPANTAASYPEYLCRQNLELALRAFLSSAFAPNFFCADFILLFNPVCTFCLFLLHTCNDLCFFHYSF